MYHVIENYNIYALVNLVSLYINETYKTKPTYYPYQYIEIQIHGNLTMNDVEKITYHRYGGTSYKSEIKKLAKKYKIKSKPF